MIRLTTPPFYLVSLPIATLIVGASMLGWYSLFVIGRLLSPYGFSWDFRFDLFFLNPIPIAFFYSDFFSWRPAAVGFFVSFWAAILFSGYLLWQTVWRADHQQSSSRVASRLGLLLLILFAWVFMYLVTYIAWVTAPWGPSS